MLATSTELVAARLVGESRFRAYLPGFVASLVGRPGPLYGQIDATVVYTDISGFTALSERSARGGRAATEELTGVLSRTFERMLEAADKLGGDLLKFGGDALIVLFQGEDHAIRASAAAWEMRSELRESSRAEQMPLHMSAGIHSGRFDWFFVGDSHREFVITGPAISALVAMEEAAVANELLLSPATFAQLSLRSRDNLRTPLAGTRLTVRPKNVTFQGEHAVDIPDRILETAIPVSLRAHMGTPTTDGEHRRVVVGFLRFSGLDPLLSANSYSFVSEMLAGLVSHVQESAARFGVCFLGTDVDSNGGKIILTAGAPTISQNDEERMLLCLHEIFTRRHPLDLRAGVNAGYVFAGDVGASRRRTYTVMGDVVNLAARIMAHAAPGQILADSAVVSRSSTAFEAKEVAPFAAKGKSGLVHAVAVGAVRRAQRVARAYHFPLANRRSELAAFATALDSIRNGDGRAIEMRGEPGVGKSRLVEELLERSTGMRTLRFSGEIYSVGFPYLAFRDVLREVVGVTDGGPVGAERLRTEVARAAPNLLPWLPLLAAVADVPVPGNDDVDDLDPRFRRARIAETVIGLLLALLPGPTVIVFEDANFLDDSSRDLLRELVASVASAPWLVCIVSHAGVTEFGDAANAAYVALEISPLAPVDMTELAEEAMSQFPVNMSVVQSAIDRAGGNPLFLLEMLAAATSGASGEELPKTVELVIVSRIDELAAADRRVLRNASVLGSTFSQSLLDACFRDDPGHLVDEDTWLRLSPFVERSPSGQFRFRHRLYREAAYEGLPFHLRSLIHGRIVQALERSVPPLPEDVEMLTLHASRAQLHDKAWRYGVMAGDRSRTRSANSEAAEFYKLALVHARKVSGIPTSEITRVQEARSEMLEVSGRYGEADEALAMAQRIVGQTDLPRVLVKRGWLRERTGEYGKALRILARARSLAAALPESATRQGIEAEAAVWSAAVYFRQGRFHEAERRCREAIRRAEACLALPTIAHACFLLDHSLYFLKSPEAGQYSERALQIYEQLGDLVGQANVLNNIGVTAYEEGRLDDALDAWQRSMEACERAGDSVGAARQRNNIGEVLSDRGQFEEAEALFRRALAVFQDTNYALGLAYARSNLGRVATRRGRMDDAATLLHEALTGFHELGAPMLVDDTNLRIVENLQAKAGQSHVAALAILDDLLSRQHQSETTKRSLLRMKTQSLLGSGQVRAAAALVTHDAVLAADLAFVDLV